MNSIPKDWQVVKLRDLSDSVDYGYTTSASREPVGPKFLRITDIVPPLIDWESVPHCEVAPEDSEKYQLMPGDIVVARTGATTGYAKQIRRPVDAVFASYLVRFRPGTRNCARYIGCVVESDEYKRYIKANLGGAAQPQANAQVLGSYPVPLPPRPTQEKIATILTAYDDLIEDNTRRIKILEEMARLIYDEWFVKFQFPGHEKVKMVQSELGPIPEGWITGTLADIVNIRREGIDPSNFKSEVFTYYSFPAFDTGRLPTLEQGDAIKSAKFLIPNDCVLLSKLNPRIPRLWLPFPPNSHRAICSSEFLVLVPKAPFNREYVYEWCKSDVVAQGLAGRSLGTSTSHQRLKPDDFLSLPTVLPTAHVLDRFVDKTRPILRLINTLLLQNHNLRQTRDLLLPKLISSEIDVERLDIKVPAENGAAVAASV
jgi:type I restriction enzyme S subunit